MASLGINFHLMMYMLGQCFVYFPSKFYRSSTHKAKIDYAVSEVGPVPSEGDLFGDPDPDTLKTLRLERILQAWNFSRTTSYTDEHSEELLEHGKGPLNNFAYYKFYDFYLDTGKLPKRIYEVMLDEYRDNIGDRSVPMPSDRNLLRQEDEDGGELCFGMGDEEYAAEIWSGEKHDTWAYLYELDDRIVATFQGSRNMTHFKVDLMAGQERVVIEPITGRRSWFSVGEQLGQRYGVEYVHRGFLGAFMDMRDNIMAWLDTPEHKDLPVMCVGHSMGAGLATMLCRFLLEEPRYRNPRNLCLVTFGSPRVGNQAFARAISSNVGEVWRLVCENDVVPSLPYEDMSSVAKWISRCCGLCIRCFMPRSVFQKFQEQHDFYTHVGIEVLLSLDGLITTEPCFVDNQYLRQSKYSCCSTKAVKNHQIRQYRKCLLRWIKHIHPPRAKELKTLMMPAPNW